MDGIKLCGWSAFQSYRTPPIVRLLDSLEVDDPLADDAPRDRLLGGISFPLHIAVADKSDRKSTRDVISHVLTKYPMSAFEVLDENIMVTDPFYTLLSMAQELDRESIAFAICEMAGGYAIFKPGTLQQEAIDLISASNLPSGEFAELAAAHRESGWCQCRTADGKPTSLWHRPPLITRDEIQNRLTSLTGSRVGGVKKLGEALALSCEGALSPLEVLANLILCTPRKCGGEGLPTPQLNAPVQLSDTAASIAGQRTCYCDMLIKGRTRKLVDIECQGEAWHKEESKVMSDFNRAAGLKRCGIEVIYLTFEVLSNEERTEALVELARRVIGWAPRPLTPKYLASRTATRAKYLKAWQTFS